MTADQFGRLTYLVLFASVLVVYMLVANRQQMGTLLRQAILWGLIFVGVIAAAGLWQDVRTTVAPDRALSFGEGQVSVPRAENGHFFLTLDVMGTPVRFVVDTGATDVVLARRDAERIGLDPEALDYTGRARTANGVVRTAPVTLPEVTLGDFVDQGVRAWVNEGELDLSLLGMSYLSRFSRVEIEAGRLVLTR